MDSKPYLIIEDEDDCVEEIKQQGNLANLSYGETPSKQSTFVGDDETKIITGPTLNVVVNKGTGAGGANTNLYGKKFEEKTNNQMRLLNDGYTKNSFTKNSTKTYDYYLSKTFEDKTIIFVLQTGLKMYMKHKYNVELF